MPGIFDPGIFDSGIFDTEGGGGGSGTYTLDAVLRRTSSASFTLDAIRRTGTSASFTFDAITILNTTPGIAQYATGNVGITMAGAITQGHGLGLFLGARASGSIGPYTGWTQSPDGDVTNPSNGEHTNYHYKTAGASESTTAPFSSFDAGGAFVEFDQAVQLDAHNFATGTSSTPSVTITASRNAIVFAVVAEGTDGGWGPQTFTPPAGWTEIFDQRVAGDHPSVWVGYRSLPNGGSITANPVCSGSGFYSIQIVSFIAVTQTKFYALDAMLRRSTSTSFSLNAILKKTVSASFTLNAVILRPNSLALDSIFKRLPSATFTFNAVLGRGGSFTLNSVLYRGGTATFTLNAFFVSFRGSFTLNALLFGTTTNVFYMRAVIYNPAEVGPNPDGSAKVFIRVNGVDITDDVVFSDAKFTTLVNGQVGDFTCRVRDTTRTRNFTTGAEITVDINGIRRFGGFLTQPKRMYAFPAPDTSNISRVDRFIVLRGTDYNILFQKRIVYDKANPKNVRLRSWDPDSRDDVVIKYVFDHYTDLNADGVTYDGVTHVDTPNPDRRGVIASGGLTFGDAMREINRLINGVWYINPYKELCFVDVDTPTASKSMSDRPVGPSEVGYRDFTMTENAANMVNDALIWGAGTGSTRVAFGRATDDDSIAEHGLWQFGEFTSALFRQASVNKRANSIVYGSPASKRGGKDDQDSWIVTTYDQSFNVGDKVTIESEVFGTSDVVPIRRMTVSFPTKTDPRFDLVLSHEIDQPWNMFEFWFPEFNVPPIDDIVVDPIPGCGPTDDCIAEPAECPEVEISHDLFTRTTTPFRSSSLPGWGSPGDTGNTLGMYWRHVGGKEYCDGARAVMSVLDVSETSPETCNEYLATASFTPHYIANIGSGDVFHWRIEDLQLTDVQGGQNSGNSIFDSGGWWWFVGYASPTSNGDAYYIRVRSNDIWELFLIPSGDGLGENYSTNLITSGTRAGADFEVEITNSGNTMRIDGSTVTLAVPIAEGRVDFSLVPYNVTFNGPALDVEMSMAAIYRLEAASFDCGSSTGCLDLEGLLVPWGDGDAPEGFCTIPDSGPGANSFCGSADSIRLYNACTYRIEYRVYYPGTEWYFIAGMPVGGMGTLVMGGTQNNEGLPPVYYASFLVTTGGGAGGFGETNVGLFAQPRSPGFSGAFGEIFARVYYVDGPDPRFDGVALPSPDSCQTINDTGVVAAGYGNTVFRTTYPYEPGTLRVFITTNGVEAEIFFFTETDPANGIFTITVGLNNNQTIRVTYLAAGSSPTANVVNTGWVRETLTSGLTRIDSTHIRTSSAIVPGTSIVFVNGEFQRPGIAREYTESTALQGILQFSDVVAVGAEVVVFYQADGPRED